VRNRECVERNRRREKGIERVREGEGKRKRGWEGEMRGGRDRRV
jgi:hypothetical protein